MKLTFAAFAALSLASIMTVEVFTVLFAYAATGSVRIALFVVTAQICVEIVVTHLVPRLTRRVRPSIMMAMGAPVRIVAFAVMVIPEPTAASLVLAAALMGVGTATGEAPRALFLARVTAGGGRGAAIGGFEVLRFAVTAATPLLVAFAIDSHGHLFVAALSSAFALGATALAFRLDHLARQGTGILPALEAEPAVPPVRLRVLWWATGLRYLAEGALYPLLAVALYASATSWGVIALAAACAGFAFGWLSDRIRLDGILVLGLAALAVGWGLRAFPLDFEIALLVAIPCAVGGKAVGVLEKKASFDHCDGVVDGMAFTARREVEMLVPRVLLLAWVLATGTSLSIAIGLVAAALACAAIAACAGRSAPQTRG